jgi:hypothetical protein
LKIYLFSDVLDTHWFIDKIHPKNTPPPPLPDLTGLRDAGIPLVPYATFLERINSENVSRRRKIVHSHLSNSGWYWDDIYQTDENKKIL